jgi:hypothetical protein
MPNISLCHIITCVALLYHSTQKSTLDFFCFYYTPNSAASSEYPHAVTQTVLKYIDHYFLIHLVYTLITKNKQKTTWQITAVTESSGPLTDVGKTNCTRSWLRDINVFAIPAED